MVFLIKQWAKNNKIDVYWIFAEAGHGKRPMDCVGACIKQTIKNIIAYNSNNVKSNTEDLMQYMPELSNICILTYKDDVNSYRELLPDTNDLKIIESGGFGISKVHKIFIPKKDNEILYWKKASSNNEYAEAQIIESKVQKRFKAKKKNKDNVMQEDLEDDWESTTVDEIEEDARKSASCILFLSTIVKTEYTANIANFNIQTI